MAFGVSSTDRNTRAAGSCLGGKMKKNSKIENSPYHRKRTPMQKMARRHNKEGGNYLEQESNRQKTMEDIDGGLYPAVHKG